MVLARYLFFNTRAMGTQCECNKKQTSHVKGFPAVLSFSRLVEKEPSSQHIAGPVPGYCSDDGQNLFAIELFFTSFLMSM